MAKKKKSASDTVIDYVSAVVNFLKGGDQELLSPLPEGYDPTTGFTGRTVEPTSSEPVYVPVPPGTKNVITAWGNPNPDEIAKMKSAGSVKGTSKKASDTPLNEYESIIVDEAKKYGVPVPVALGMFYAETGGKPSLGADRNNVYNINAIDSDPDQAFTYSTPREGVEAYMKLLTNSDRYQPAMALKDNPEAMLRKIAELGYAGDPKTYAERADAKNPVTGQKYASYADFVLATPGWRKGKKL